MAKENHFHNASYLLEQLSDLSWSSLQKQFFTYILWTKVFTTWPYWYFLDHTFKMIQYEYYMLSTWRTVPGKSLLTCWLCLSIHYCIFNCVKPFHINKLLLIEEQLANILQKISTLYDFFISLQSWPSKQAQVGVTLDLTYLCRWGFVDVHNFELCIIIYFIEFVSEESEVIRRF